MYEQVAAGVLADLAPEIIWRELARGLSAQAPSRMLRALRECDALAVLQRRIDAAIASKLACMFCRGKRRNSLSGGGTESGSDGKHVQTVGEMSRPHPKHRSGIHRTVLPRGTVHTLQASAVVNPDKPFEP
jgi:hypothetical protein